MKQMLVLSRRFEVKIEKVPIWEYPHEDTHAE